MPTYTKPTDLALLEPKKLAAALRLTVESGLANQLAVYDDVISAIRPGEGKWSAKEVVGHLIDSAGNNLQRMVRLGIDETLQMPGYKQMEWVAVQHYQERHWSDLVILWSALNLHLAHVISYADKSHFGRVWSFEGGDVTLGFLIEDYIAHLQHHLDRMPAL